MMSLHRPTGVFLAMATLCASCAAPAKAGDCGPDALGVARTIEVAASASGLEGELEEGEVVLTFDDGPHPWRTKRVLEALGEECVEAVFFLRGDKAASYRRLVRRIVADGHQLGGHGWAHANLAKLSAREAQADIERGQAAIETALGPGVEIGFFRFPFVATTPALSSFVRELGLVEVGVDVDGQDWTGAAPQDVVDMIVRKLEARGRRGVVLLHDPFDQSVASTRLLLARLKAEGYGVVAVRRVGASSSP